MKEHPIPVYQHEARAILDGSQTQLRRALRKQPPANTARVGRGVTGFCVAFDKDDRENGWTGYTPYSVGDRLWVRERYVCQVGENGRPRGRYCTDGSWFSGKITDNHPTKKLGLVTIPSIHMPRWASRTLLEVVSVRVERVQDISDIDCQSEGIIDWVNAVGRENLIKTRSDDPFRDGEPWPSDVNELADDLGIELTYCYACLWDSINKSRGYGWDANPWVWVVEFRMVKP